MFDILDIDKMIIILWCQLLYLQLFSTFTSAQVNPDGPLVRTPQGLIQGSHKKSYRNRTYSAFEGIPYAKPPIGHLRFQEPVPADIWKDTLIANKQYECLQFIPFPLFFGPRGSEDCLYIYVYVPREDINPNELLDVVVHIHGGGFMLGSPKFMAGPQFLMDQDIVYVSFNYRLNAIGFLSTEDEIVPGNNGLKDQTLALEWIKENIKFFGGNPASITLTGLSAGAASVHLHYLSPLSKGLFHQGLSQSGTALQCWTLKENPMENTQILAKNLSCPISSSKEITDCLRRIDSYALMNATRSLYKYIDGIPFITFGPVIEPKSNNSFLSEHPYKIIEKGEVYDVPWITSNTKDEGLFPVRFILWLQKLQELEEKWHQIMPYALEMTNTLDESVKHEVMSQIKTFYFKDQPITQDNVYSLIDLFTDRMFLMNAERAVKLHASAVKSEVYYYLFSYVLQMPSFPPANVVGASHGDDSRLMLDMLGTPKKLKENDEKMMVLFTEFIAEYARTGVPKFNNVEWLPQDRHADKINYLNIESVGEIEMKTTSSLGFSEFWSTLPIKELDKSVSSGTSLKHVLMLHIVFIFLLVHV